MFSTAWLVSAPSTGPGGITPAASSRWQPMTGKRADGRVPLNPSDHSLAVGPEAASKETPLPRLNPDCRAVINHFVYSMMNGLLGHPLLESIDYRPVLMEEGSAAEQACAVFCNVLELDIDGQPINANEAETRAAQYIRGYCDDSYEIDPPFEGWETDRPIRKGKKLGPMP